ncbi:MAG: glycerophosphodiester phosphodiesterase [Candidatus Auribacter fodinae]|jgi:glycerophosphoryl diester phosphodiesterase|uniref:Glycerophosphodiester phosphodiesterase n=1 Tax=Candidatus Auribacter fodinae TaxID=2093366 RepID=A0A3A4R3K2_9BACT|nr:MAG: glycerophosphodiester phosphodiesterase [Candidatus Auribacter fodinae]
MIQCVDKKTLIIAHRGSSAYEIDNTLDSFQRAIDQKADMIEFDVRRTKDNVIIAFHDPAVSRTPVRELTYAELNELTKAKGYQVPTLKEILQLTHRKIRLDIELKEPGYEADVMKLVEKYFCAADFIVTSFKDSCLATIKEISDDIKTGLLLGEDRFNNFLLTNRSLSHLVERCRRTQADFLVPSMTLLRFGFMKRVAELKKNLIVWTVNDNESIFKLLKDSRVNAIITDKPDIGVSLRDTLSFPVFMSIACQKIS